MRRSDRQFRASRAPRRSIRHSQKPICTSCSWRTSPTPTHACTTPRRSPTVTRCAESIDSSRRLIALDPATTSGYLFLAEAIVGDGRPTESAQVALEERWKRLPESAREEARLRDGANLAIVEGRLAHAAGLLEA